MALFSLESITSLLNPDRKGSILMWLHSTLISMRVMRNIDSWRSQWRCNYREKNGNESYETSPGTAVRHTQMWAHRAERSNKKFVRNSFVAECTWLIHRRNVLCTSVPSRTPHIRVAVRYCTLHSVLCNFHWTAMRAHQLAFALIYINFFVIFFVSLVARTHTRHAVI